MTTETRVFDDNMTGIISTNDFKEKENQPDYKGKCKIRGIWFWVSGWKRAGKNGTFLSLAYTEMTAEDAAKQEAKSKARQAPQQGGDWSQGNQPQQSAPAQQQAPAQSGPMGDNPPPSDFDDDIPF